MTRPRMSRFIRVKIVTYSPLTALDHLKGYDSAIKTAYVMGWNRLLSAIKTAYVMGLESIAMPVEDFELYFVVNLPQISNL